ncbi:phosphatase domain-containing protein [uncultured Jannaschia sp.]|uniref:phosphatase domain-containing protein n=1 Tax=uncultured Jannaschia sp. TaxID=293347 RepID=UPI002608DA4B|nr:phosphatase domain-containing protein [uncultured Jannaschia sp.]
MLKPLALRAARLVESGLERIGDRSDDDPVLDPYLGYATPEGLVLRGRVLTHLRRAEPDAEQSKWMNLRQMANLFITDEVQGVTVEGGGASGLSDAEGYVRLTVAGDFDPGWATVQCAIPGQDPVAFHARVPAPDAEYMLISDIDDTMIETGAHSLARNLWTTFTGSALTRQAHDDAIALVESMTDGTRHPIFYVSSSPWNLHDFLEDLFRHEGVPRGPMFLRDLGITEEGVGASHGTHKGRAIDAILAANPDLDAYLMGDSGQKDAIVYRDAVRRHPGRIRGVALREPAPGVGDDDANAIAEIEADGVPCYHGPDFTGARRHWGLE